MPNLEAVKPMLKEIEESLDRMKKFYVPPQKLMLTAPLPPRISETIERNELITEIKALRSEVEKLTDNKSASTPQTENKESEKVQKTLNGQTKSDSLPIAYTIKSTYRHEIVINNKYQLRKPQYGRTNDLVFCYLVQNANRSVSKEEVEKAIGKSTGKPFNTILNELGFVGELRRLFFPNVSKSAIECRNNLTQQDLLAAKIDEKKLDGQLKKLKIWEDKI
jgi:predicted transcriptional regulator